MLAPVVGRRGKVWIGMAMLSLCVRDLARNVSAGRRAINVLISLSRILVGRGNANGAGDEGLVVATASELGSEYGAQK